MLLCTMYVLHGERYGQVRELMGQFSPLTPLALVLKQFLADRSLDHAYKGGLSSYCQVSCHINPIQTMTEESLI